SAAGPVAVELDVAADPAAVFALLTEPAGVELWLGDDAVLDPRPGGIFRVVVGGDVARGEFVHVDPPHRVAFTWGREGDEGPLGSGATRVDVALAARPGGARVRVEHRGLPPSADAPHLAAWAHHLAQLGEVARQASAANAAS